MATESHLQMIQGVITRLSSQSMTIKGWSVTVARALLGFGASTATPVVAAVAIYVVCAFAVLDAYYLTLERAYRELYRRAVADQATTWSLDVGRPTVRRVAGALRSPAVSILYGTSLLVAADIGGYLLSQ